MKDMTCAERQDFVNKSMTGVTSLVVNSAFSDVCNSVNQSAEAETNAEEHEPPSLPKVPSRLAVFRELSSS